MRISDWSSDVCSSDLGQGPRSCAAAPAAVGETILSGKGFIPSPAKWWGPAVLEAECGRTSYWAIREPAPLPSRLAPDGCGRAPFFSFSYTLRTVAEELSRDHKPRGRKGLTCPRSEEHTSELQSLMRTSYAVFCLKKKNHNTQI